ncbi:11654_t:CDS:2, partial [Acaulospora colombiana]
AGTSSLPGSQPLSAIAERTMSGAEESDEEEEDVEGGWQTAKSIGNREFVVRWDCPFGERNVKPCVVGASGSTRGEWRRGFIVYGLREMANRASLTMFSVLVQELAPGESAQPTADEKLLAVPLLALMHYTKLITTLHLVTVGAVDRVRPGLLHPEGQAKWDAWSEAQTTPGEDCKRLYVEKVIEVISSMPGRNTLASRLADAQESEGTRQNLNLRGLGRRIGTTRPTATTTAPATSTAPAVPRNVPPPEPQSPNASFAARRSTRVNQLRVQQAGLSFESPTPQVGDPSAAPMLNLRGRKNDPTKLFAITPNSSTLLASPAGSSPRYGANRNRSRSNRRKSLLGPGQKGGFLNAFTPSRPGGFEDSSLLHHDGTSTADSSLMALSPMKLNIQAEGNDDRSVDATSRDAFWLAQVHFQTGDYARAERLLTRPFTIKNAQDISVSDSPIDPGPGSTSFGFALG